MIMDRIEKVNKKLDIVDNYYEHDRRTNRWSDLVQPIPLNKGLTFRNVPAMQAADFLAWEIRRNHLDDDVWWSIEDRPKTGGEAFDHYMDWARIFKRKGRESFYLLMGDGETYGSVILFWRMSLGAGNGLRPFRPCDLVKRQLQISCIF
jgi:hypothetical protein